MNNSEIRTVQFNQGVGVALPPDGDADESVSLANNSVTDVTENYDAEAIACVIIDYWLYRKTNLSSRWMSGKIKMRGVPQGIIDADAWDMIEEQRSEEGESGVDFSLVRAGTQAKLVATLDSMAGTGHECTMYYKVSTLSA